MSPAREPSELGALDTEAVRPELADLDVLDVADLVALLSAESTRASAAVVAAADQIAGAVAGVAARLAAGGRLIYVGAGTAGRLGVLDAAEAGPTFNVEDGLVVGVLAGGSDAFLRPKEGAEDDAEAGAAALAELDCSDGDAVVGISASGRTPYVIGALAQARSVGALTVGIVCSRDSEVARAAELAIELLVGGEAIAGSTRLNAGTAQKITLNIISTAVMVQLGKTYGNLMVDVRPTNEKLRDRAVRIVAAVARTSPARAREALEVSGWRTKLACVVAATGLGSTEADRLLVASAGRLRIALEAAGTGQRAGTGQHAATGAVAARPDSQRRLGASAFLWKGRLVPGDVAVADGKVAALGLPPGRRGIAVPGLVDLQVNGYAGLDALGASHEELVTLARALARDGVLAYQPTLISSDLAATRRAARTIADMADPPRDGARLLGIHLEGPFVSPLRAGTHPLERLAAPDLGLLGQLLDGFPVTMITIAPELPGALELVAECLRRGIVVSFGHSDADATEARRGFDAGGRAVTHVFNAMAPLTARAPGLAGAALADPRVTVQLIADKVHLADDTLRLVVSAAAGRWSLVSDATAASAFGEGEVLLGEVPVTAVQGVARRADGTLAGSAARLLDGVRRLADLGVALGDVLAAATERPADLLGRADIGRIFLGGPADIVLLGDGLEVDEVIVGGRSI